MYGLVSQFESNFGVVAIQFLEEEDRLRDTQPQPAMTSGGWVVLTQGVIVPPSFSLLLNQQVAKSKRIKSRGSSPNLMSYGTQGVGASQRKNNLSYTKYFG